MPILVDSLISHLERMPQTLRSEYRVEADAFVANASAAIRKTFPQTTVTFNEFYALLPELMKLSHNEKLPFVAEYVGNLLQSLNKADLNDDDQKGLTALLFNMISVGHEELLTIMVSRKLGIDGTQPGIEGDYNALMYSIWCNNEKAFKILQPFFSRKGLLNEQNQSGETALYLCVALGREAMLEELLKDDELVIDGRRNSSTLFDLVRDKPQWFQKLVGTFNDNESMIYYQWNFSFHLPVALLHEKQQASLKNAVIAEIEHLPDLNDHPETKSRLLAFLHDDAPLPFKRLNRLAIVFEAIGYLKQPEWINQHSSNLCGPAVVMQQLVVQHPYQFIDMVLDLVELSVKKPATHLPANVKLIPQYTRDTAWNLSSLWLETMRHNYNALLGFSADSHYASWTALTTPQLLTRMFQDVGIKVLQENLQVRFSKNTKYAAVLESVRPTVAKFGFLFGNYKIYGAKHLEQSDNTNRFKQFLQWVGEEPSEKFFTIMINRYLLNEILGSKFQDTQVLLEFSHYVNISKFAYDRDVDKVSFECATFGNIYQVAGLDAKVFANHFLGGFHLEQAQQLRHIASPQ